MSMSLTIDRLFNTTPERLYDVWTNATHLTRWFGVKVDADPKIGGVIRFHFEEECGPNHGAFVALEPHHYVAFTWNAGSGNSEPDTTVHVNFRKEGEATRLTLRHEGFLDQKSFDAHDEGWLSYMELWNMLINVRPDEKLRATISETFSTGTDLIKAIAGWVGTPESSLELSDDPAGVRSVRSPNLEARLMPCRFGVCLSLAEWGFANEEERLAARTKWVSRFASLKSNDL